MMMTAEQAKTRLESYVRPGDTLYTILRHVSASGIQRRISVIAIKPSEFNPQGEPYEIDYLVAPLLGDRIHRDGGIIQRGCGMDMGFNLVHNLSLVLHPDGFTCTGQGCPSNDHSNGDRDYTPHHHTGHGYSLKQRWL